jgi:hypothetical protein
MRNTSILAGIFALGLFSLSNSVLATDNGPETDRCAQAHQSVDSKGIAQYCQHAQYHERRGRHDDDDGPGAPSGSFVESCRNTHQKGWTVYSECRDRKGHWSRTSINFRSCHRYKLENLNGNLVCER